MKTAFLFLFPLWLSAQTYPIPVKILDSLIFETRKGRAADTVIHAQTAEISALTSQVKAQVDVIALLQTENSQLEALSLTLQQRFENERQLDRNKIDRLKIKLRKGWKVVILEGGVIVVLILL